jgi:lipoprotein NlpD
MERIKEELLRNKIYKSPLVHIFLILVISIFIINCSSQTPYVQKPKLKGVYHRVKKGETAWSIARAYNLKLQDLAEINNIEKPEQLEEGSVLFIPDANQVIDDVMTHAKVAKAAEVSSPKAASKDDPNNKSLPGKIDNNKGVSEKTSAPPDDKKRVLPGAVNGKLPSARELPGEAVPPSTANKADAKTERKTGIIKQPEENEGVQFEKSRFIWPVRGSVKTRFGIQPDKTFHNWIKISSSMGMPVKAAAAGTVIFSSFLKDFGETIIIRHQDNFATVYTHIQNRRVKSDQNIKRGETIAFVGEKDETGVAYINFEVRVGGKVRNPLFFLP